MNNLKNTIHKSFDSRFKITDNNAKALVQENLERILSSLEESKGEDIVTIDLRGRSPLADYMVIASGRSQRHVSALAEHLLTAIKSGSSGYAKVEGLSECDWVLIDCGDIIVHLFRPETREFYNLEKMWGIPDSEAPISTSAGGAN